jgi:serine phosphatase RsbU (regulator of sigma subunit)
VQTYAGSGSRPDLALPDPRQAPISPLGHRTWTLIRVILAGSLLSLGAHRLFGPDSNFGVLVLLGIVGATWLTVLRMLLLDSKARIFWLIWLAAGFVLTLATGSGQPAQMVAVLFSGVFLLIRRYRCYRELSTGRRAAVFFLGILAAVALTMGWDTGGALAEGTGGIRPVAAVLARGALGSLRLFWLFTLLNLFFGMRLRGFRLRTKLAVSALFLSFIPIVLLLIFGFMFTYGALGGSRAARTSALLGNWSEQVRAGVELDRAPFTHLVRARLIANEWVGEGESPVWLDALGRHLREQPVRMEPDRPAHLEAESRPETPADRDAGLHIQLGEASSRTHRIDWAPADTTAFFHIGNELWLLRIEGLAADTLTVRGYEIDSGVMDHLSDLLMCNVGIYSHPNLVTTTGGGTVITQAAVADSAREILSIQGMFAGLESETAGKLGFLGKPLGFGAGLRKGIRMGPTGFYLDELLFHLKVSLYGLSLEFLRDDYRLNQALLGGLVVAAVLLLVVQGFAFFLGMRITTGITAAVRDLHRGTLRLAGGDLNARVEVVNQDEFGDLAQSFNEMALAVRRGREEAVAHERLERELETARAIQSRLLPDETPTVPGFEITGTSLPSRQVGGDYFDFLHIGENRIGVAIGDVSGKGIPAALLMSNLQACLQGQVIHPSSVAEVVGRVNDLLARSTDAQMFATFCYGLLDFQQATFTVTNAGHNPPILCRLDGTVELIESGGLLLGMMPGLQYQQETVEFGPGDVLVLYTDGVTEAEGPIEIAEDGRVRPARPVAEGMAGGQGAEEEEDAEYAQAPEDVPENMFGERRLIEIIQRNADASAAEIREEILKAVDRHAAGVPQSDDITLVVIKRPPALG